MSERQFKELTQKIDTLIKLTAFIALKDVKTKTEKIGILDGLGLRKKEIALIVDTTEESVRTVKKRLKKRTKRRRGKKGEQQ